MTEKKKTMRAGEDGREPTDSRTASAVSVTREAVQHTPGPWHASKRRDRPWSVVRGDSRDIADVWNVPGTQGVQATADAHLIAAAPDLLAACKAALNDRMYREWPQAADVIMAAITKAEAR